MEDVIRTAFADLFKEESIARAILSLMAVATVGLGLGAVRIGGVRLGVAGVLFAGILAGYLGLSINHAVLDFAREFGLILFVYTIGLQVGPSLVASLRRNGLVLNLLAAGVVFLGALITVAWNRWGGIDSAVAAGLFAGATTNTPALAAAQQALRDANLGGADATQWTGLGYALAYPFGIVGILITMGLVRVLLRVQPTEEAERFHDEQLQDAPALINANLEVRNPGLAGASVEKILALSRARVTISRVLHDGEIHVAEHDAKLELGDIIHVVGPEQAVQDLRMVVGGESRLDLRAVPGSLLARRIVVTRHEVVGRTIGELDLWQHHGVCITRMSRAEIELVPHPQLRLQVGDIVLAVGEKAALERASAKLGDSAEQLNTPEIVPVLFGIALGVLVGSLRVGLPGLPAPVKLGLAGGPLLVALVLSRQGRIGPLVFHMPIGPALLLKELGIALFLACVGLSAGPTVGAVLPTAQGLFLVGAAALVTIVPLVLVGFAARLWLRLNFLTLCGLLAGSMTDPPALAFANAITPSNAQSVAYATVYPLTMLLRVLTAQVLVLLVLQ